MKKLLYTILLTSLVTMGISQNPEITSWMRNETGVFAEYEFYDGPPEQGTTFVQMSDSSDVKSVCYDDDYVYITANGLASYTMGPFLMNPNEPSNQDYTLKLTRNPEEETGNKSEISSVGAIGFAVNGVVLYGFGDAKSYSKLQGDNVSNGDGVWETDAWISEGETMDATGGGHADDRGAYHYHANPITLYEDPSTDHSPIIGYALDGFPIYGPFGYSDPYDPTSSITRMVSGYELRNITDRTTLPDGSNSMPPGPSISEFDLGTYIQDYAFTGAGDLDEYNGRYCVTPEYPDTTYAYFLSTDNAGEPAFPYLLAEEYFGVVSQMDIMMAGSSSTPTGVTCYTGGTITSIENELEISIDLFPNPAAEKISINTEEIPNAISIFDINGVTVGTFSPTSTSTEINTASYVSGLYFVKVDMGSQSRTLSLQIME